MDKNTKRILKAQKKILDAQVLIATVQGNSPEWWQVRRLSDLVGNCMNLVQSIEKYIEKNGGKFL